MISYKTVRFYKYHGTGNDFILFDNRDGTIAHDRRDWFVKLCHRRFGIGADGVILIEKHKEADFRMVYFNADGRPGSMCGNGGRCAAQFAKSEEIVDGPCIFEAADGFHEAEFTERGVKLKMNEAQGYKVLENGDYWIDTGSPHHIRFLDEDVKQYPVVENGREIRNSPAYIEKGTNVNFVTVNPDGNLDVRTYERGVEDETFSCGTGVTAVAEVYVRNHHGISLPVEINTPGGRLWIHVIPGSGAYLEGPAQFVFVGSVNYPEEV